MITALQVSGGGLPLLFTRRRRRAFRPPQAVASDAAAAAAEGTAREDGGKVALGGSGVSVTKLGVGAWSWGDTTYWNEFRWDDTKLKAAKGAFDASIDCGITFFDTAEVYGAGVSGAINSESLLGRFINERQRKEQVDVAVATKFAALPWRFGRGSVICALKASLDRLGVSSVELYQLHWPGIWGNEDYLDGLGDAVEQGLVKAVGVSNYSEKRLRDAYERLRKRGVPLASNQVNYSLIYRNPEENGVKAACDELGVTLIAYSPIAQGALTGKYTPESPPKGPRGRIYTPEFLTKLQPLINRIKEIGGSYGRTSTQVVLNWLVCQGNVVPIPGAKNAEQAREFAGALGWSLAPDEVEELRSMARQVKPVIGFPVEKL
ncbi:putative oxidoreductase [Zea mays]|uniref:Putative oxidoreductase n=1 Tax=Zea mays TaxID=4577 RepID=A0A3L6G0G5_MAIZE|nr:putative oxidoreductase [Zea mays]